MDKNNNNLSAYTKILEDSICDFFRLIKNVNITLFRLVEKVLKQEAR